MCLLTLEKMIRFLESRMDISDLHRRVLENLVTELKNRADTSVRRAASAATAATDKSASLKYDGGKGGALVDLSEFPPAEPDDDAGSKVQGGDAAPSAEDLLPECHPDTGLAKTADEETTMPRTNPSGATRRLTSTPTSCQVKQEVFEDWSSDGGDRVVSGGGGWEGGYASRVRQERIEKKRFSGHDSAGKGARPGEGCDRDVNDDDPPDTAPGSLKAPTDHWAVLDEPPAVSAPCRLGACGGLRVNTHTC
ncbi:hypothetical protein GGS23DRAFT_591011 [Durotheca rogersii]|uniref:uncharacterized protein n=1 Tax=Durotheca rogersii TaxID=419775 RepID=UPI0022200330|nr:uncharacterized protein GGS23DRAFT_591011 [Durotheca rogersii]KAI5853672.1 hypothetical protein GGS23DRAFT_591011 [Durotheca rogersii]